MDEVVAYRQTVGGVVGVYYPHYNHLYSVAALTKVGANGPEVVERYTYDAYGKQKITDASGNVTRAKSSVGWDRGFTGYITDNETGLLHARARQYSPTLGRFVSRDPWQLDARAPKSRDGYHDGMNLYGSYFVPNATDPTGKSPCEVAIGACLGCLLGTGPNPVCLGVCAMAAALCAAEAAAYYGSMRCLVQVVSSTCQNTGDMVGSQWCVACESKNKCCPFGQQKQISMLDIPYGSVPASNSPRCTITVKYITPKCAPCPAGLGDIKPAP